MALLKSAALKKRTKLFLKASSMQETKLKKCIFFRKLKTLLKMKSVSELLSSKGACVFASRKQAVIECRQNIAPEKKDVRYVLYFLSWDRTERLLNLICCWDYILSVKAPLPTELTTFCLVFSSRMNLLPSGRSPWAMLFPHTPDACLQLQKSLDLLTRPRAGLHLAVDCSRYKSKEKSQKMTILCRTHPLMGRGGGGGADQVLTFHEVPIIGHASFERQRRRNVGDVGAGHTIQLQIWKNQHRVNNFDNWIESKDPDCANSYDIDSAIMLHMRYLCLLFTASIIICSSSNEGF